MWISSDNYDVRGSRLIHVHGNTNVEPRGSSKTLWSNEKMDNNDNRSTIIRSSITSTPCHVRVAGSSLIRFGRVNVSTFRTQSICYIIIIMHFERLSLSLSLSLLLLPKSSRDVFSTIACVWYFSIDQTFVSYSITRQKQNHESRYCVLWLFTRYTGGRVCQTVSHACITVYLVCYAILFFFSFLFLHCPESTIWRCTAPRRNRKNRREKL